MSIKDSYIATTRFGLGARPGELAKYSNSSRAWLKGQLEKYRANSGVFSNLLSQDDLREIFAKTKGASKANKKRFKKEQKEIYADEVRARVKNGVITETPFVERLVYFWSNHFTVSTSNNKIVPLVGLFEREVIRENVLGSFEGMLLASCQHPTMLMYLDNFKSIGPNSRTGKRAGKGLNENLAREILELHTLGVDGGYNQNDVIGLAKIITGWTATPKKGFEFIEKKHEPGSHLLLNRKYSQKGVKQGIEAIKDLAREPATARFVAKKIVTHFISDDPSTKVIKKVEDVFIRTGGDLKQIALALIDMKEAWEIAPGKIKTPNDFVISAARAVGLDKDVDVKFLGQTLRAFGQFPFTASSPAGFSDMSAQWTGPEAILRRVEWAELAAKKLMTGFVDVELPNQILHPVLKVESYEAVRAAKNKREALAIMLALPEFQRR